MFSFLEQYNFSGISFTQLYPFLSFVMVLSLGAAVLLQDRKSRVNQLFFLFNFAIACWFFGTFMMFASITEAQVLFWDRFVYIGVSFTPGFLIHMSLLFANKKPSKKILFPVYISAFIWLLLSRTNLFMKEAFQYTWGAHGKAEILHHFFLLYFALLITASLVILFKNYKKAIRENADQKEKLHAKLTFIAVLILAVFGSMAYLPAYNFGIYPFSLLSGVAFSGILTYAITKYNLFDMKMIAAQVFIFFMWLVSAANMLIAESPKERIRGGVIFASVSGFGVLLIRNLLQETKQKEQLATLNSQLTDLNENLEAKVAEQTKEIRRAYEVEKKARHELEELDKAKTDFILTTQHHLRTPLTVVKGVANMLVTKEEGAVITKQDKLFIEKLASGSNKLGNLINEFLDISQMEVGKSILKKSETNIYSLIQESLGEVSHEIEQKQMRMETTFSDEARTVSFPIDPKRM
jgi:signal transduction histidine kinase